MQEGEMSTRAHILVVQNLKNLFDLSPHVTIHPRDEVGFMFFIQFSVKAYKGSLVSRHVPQEMSGKGRVKIATLPDGEIVGDVATRQRNFVATACYIEVVRMAKWRKAMCKISHSEEISKHVEECFECKVEIVEVLELIEAIGPPADEPHPFFVRM